MDAEGAATIELGKRISRWRLAIVSVAVVTGVAAGIVGYWLFRAWQVRTNGAHAPFLTGGVTFAIGLAVIFLGWLIARLLIRARRRSWATEIAARHGVPSDFLEEIAETLR